MSVSLEHDYLGFSEVPSNSMERSGSDMNGGELNFKATELRLGLPGSKSPERGCGLKGLSSAGAKRGFSDALEGGSGSEAGDLGKDLAASDGKTQQMGFTLSALKDSSPQTPNNVHEKKPQASAPAAKAQVVGWPPVRSFRKNSMAQKNEEKSGSGCLYVKVSMDGAPYLRKVDLNTYGSYMDLSSALEKMFRCFTIRQCGSHGVSGRDGLSESRLMDLLQGAEYVLTYEDKDGDWMLVGDVPWEMFTESCKRMRIMKSSDAIGLAPRAMEKCKNRN